MPAQADKRLNLTREDDSAWMRFLHDQAARLRREKGMTRLERLTLELDKLPFDELSLFRWTNPHSARQEEVYSESLLGAKLQGTVTDVNTVDLTLLLSSGATVRVESANAASYFKLRFFMVSDKLASLV